ncbi:PIG-L domain-containing protein [Planctomycetales bacterium]|nr:PIG-L domain-containing protein [Planctomycetales bacterium]
MSNILIAAPHIDDETLGCGATMARLASEGHDITVVVMAGHGNIREGIQGGGEWQHPLGNTEYFDRIKREGSEAMKVLGVKEPVYLNFPVLMIPKYYSAIEVNKFCGDVVQKFQPDILFIPYLWDVHEDHHIMSNAFSIAARPNTEYGRNIKEIYMYEVVSETHWTMPFVEPAFVPNVWFDVSNFLEKKLKAFACFKSQCPPFPHARSIKAIESLALWRGSQMSMNAAEAFIAVRQFK